MAKANRPRTLSDIAVICGVSPSTVSRVLNNEPGISLETRALILGTVDKNNFQHKKRIKQLSRSQISLCIVIPEKSEIDMNPFFDMSELLNSINSSFMNDKKTIEILSFPEFSEQILSSRFYSDGVILAFGNPGTEVVGRLREKEIPYVFLNRAIENENYICSNNYKGMLKLGKYLESKGYKKTAYLGSSTSPVNVDRFRGYCTFKLERGESIDRCRIINAPSIASIDESIADQFINSDCDSVMCFNDNFAVRLINILQTQGVKIPHDIAVTGFDDSPLRKISRPLITTVSLSTYEIGFFASRWLRDVIVHQKMRTVHLEVEGELLEGETV